MESQWNLWTIENLIKDPEREINSELMKFTMKQSYLRKKKSSFADRRLLHNLIAETSITN